MTQEEHEREYRIIDQMISMHAHLAQTKRRQATLLTVCLLLASAIICAFTFADDTTMALLGMGAAKARFALGIASAVVFGVSIVELKVDWSGIAQSHRDATRRLSALKAKYRRVHASTNADSPEAWATLSKDYAETMDSVVAVPESRFTRLKARHLFKKELSKVIDKNPGVPSVVLASVLRIRATWNYLLHRTDRLMQDDHSRK